MSVKLLQINIWLLIFLTFSGLKIQGQTTTTIPTGSFIINMGVTPQTFQNGLRPYGMIYDLIKNYNVPIIWSINPSKPKDGIDFSHNGTDFRGGPFIVSAEFRTTAVNGRIAYWQTQGIVGITTVSPVTVPVFQTLRAAPRWTPDEQNGSIAVGYLQNAMIPPAAYGGTASSGWKEPSELNCCDDIFIMPHADPVWATHQNLLNWNLDCRGAIWAACHAGSALENMVNPANRNQQTNFLTVKDPAWKGTSGDYTLSNALILWGSHSGGTPPYTTLLPADPIQQYMGTIDAATQNGSEQIFMPRQGIVANPSTYSASAVSRWNPSTNILVYDPTQVNVTNPDLVTLKNVAAVMMYGRGFGDTNRGWVMYEAGHSHNKASGPANVAAQRAMLNFSFLATNDKTVLPEIDPLPTVFTGGAPVSLSYSLPAGANQSDYTTQWTTSCGGTFSPNSTSNPTTYTPPVVTVQTPCVLSLTITDLCGRTSNDSKGFIIEECELVFNNTITNVSCNGQSNGQISMSITGSTGPFTWNWTRVSPAGNGSGSGTTISGLLAGTYNVTVTDPNSCSGTFTALITQPNVLSASTTVTNYLCFGQTGAINLTVTGGTPSYLYSWTGPNGFTATTKDISGLLAGSYSVTVTDSKGCTVVKNATVTGPATAVSVTLNSKTNINCNGNNNGTIYITASGGTPGYSYLWNDGSTSEDRTGLAPGTYTVTVTDAGGCTGTLTETITQPALLVLSVDKTDPTCPPGANPPAFGSDGAIDLTVTGGTPSYTYNWTDLTPPPAEPEDRGNLPAGTYTVQVTDNNGCQASISVTLIEQNPLVLPPTDINNN